MIYCFLLDLSAVLICGWTGYFLTHDAKTVSSLHLSVLLGVYAALFSGATFIRGAGFARKLAMPDASDMERIEFPFRLPLDIVIFLGLTLIAMAPFGGFDLRTLAFAVTIASYAGIMRALRASSIIEKQVFTVVLAIVVIGLLVLAGLALTAPYGMLSAVLLVWPLLRIVWYGRIVLQKATKRSIDHFAVHAIAGTGVVAGALLAMRIGPERRQVINMTWVVIPAALAVILVRLGPQIWRKSTGSEETDSR